MANLKTNNETVLSLTSGIDSNQRIIQNKQPIKIFKKNPLDKLKHFLNQYKKLFILIWQSIIPDLKCFLWWQVVLLLLFAIFNVIFSILVSRFILCLIKRIMLCFRPFLSFVLVSIDLKLGFQCTFSFIPKPFVTTMDKRYASWDRTVASNSSMLIGCGCIH